MKKLEILNLNDYTTEVIISKDHFNNIKEILKGNSFGFERFPELDEDFYEDVFEEYSISIPNRNLGITVFEDEDESYQSYSVGVKKMPLHYLVSHNIAKECTRSHDDLVMNILKETDISTYVFFIQDEYGVDYEDMTSDVIRRVINLIRNKIKSIDTSQSRVIEEILNRIEEEMEFKVKKSNLDNITKFHLNRISYEYLREAILHKIDVGDDALEKIEEISIGKADISFINYHVNGTATKFVLTKRHSINIDDEDYAFKRDHERAYDYEYFVYVYNFECGCREIFLPQKIDIERIIDFLEGDLLYKYSTEVTEILDKIKASIY